MPGLNSVHKVLTANPGRLSNKFLEQRMRLFFALARRVPKPAKMLDVGGTPDFWRESLPEGFSVTILNVVEQQPLKGMEAIVGDACNLEGFADNAFDVVFSNSVIGHVGGWQRQKQMANEMRRVGRRYFVQTPNQRFPIDWRTLVPFFHWLPPSVQAWCFQRFRVGRYRRAASGAEAMDLATRVRNLTRREMVELFPEGEMLSERVMGFTKSFMAYHGF